MSDDGIQQRAAPDGLPTRQMSGKWSFSMRRLMLHIGSHKTGTTTLQSSLRSACRKKKLGEWSYSHASDTINMNNVVAIKGDGADMRWRVRVSVLESQLPMTGNCIISGERLFWMDSKKEISSLANTLKAHFDEINVVAYLRRQDSLALSFRKTAVTMRPAGRFFGHSANAFPEYLPHMDRYFDYASKINIWENVFGARNVIVRKYESSSLLGNDTVSDFSNILGHKIKPISKRLNKSWSRGQVLVGMWLLSKGYLLDHFHDIVLSIKDDEKLLPSRSDAERFMERFKDSNKTLAKKYDPSGPVGYFNDDFSCYPEQGNDDISSLSLDLGAIEAEVSKRIA
jgi:hypothetical protein